MVYLLNNYIIHKIMFISSFPHNTGMIYFYVGYPPLYVAGVRPVSFRRIFHVNKVGCENSEANLCLGKSIIVYCFVCLGKSLPTSLV